MAGAGAGAGRPYKPTSVRIYLTVGVVSSRGVGGWYPTVPSNLAFFPLYSRGSISSYPQRRQKIM